MRVGLLLGCVLLGFPAAGFHARFAVVGGDGEVYRQLVADPHLEVEAVDCVAHDLEEDGLGVLGVGVVVSDNILGDAVCVAVCGGAGADN